jgi:hypothetical protein
MTQNTLEFQEAKLARLETITKGSFGDPNESARLSHVVEKCKRRIQRLKSQKKEESK